MTVTPLQPDLPAGDLEPRAREAAAPSFGPLLEAGSAAFGRAQAAEAEFVSGRGSLLSMVLERAQADVVLSVACAAASRTAQAVSTVFNLQV